MTLIRTRAPLGAIVLAVAVGLAGTGRAKADPFPPDPVEAFRDALNLEYKRLPDFKSPLGRPYKERLSKDPVALKLALDFRRKNLEKAAKGLRTPAQLSKALLLLDWPGLAPRPQPGERPRPVLGEDTPYDIDSRGIESQIRVDMVKRFIAETREGLEGRPAAAGRPAVKPAAARQIALSNLVAETVLGDENISASDAGLKLYVSVEQLVPALVKVLATTDNSQVKAAAARALGYFPKKAKAAAGALEGVLARTKDSSPAARLAAARGLVELVQSLTGEETNRASEPGVSVAETRTSRSKSGIDPAELVSVIDAITPAVVAGVRDPSPAVRQTALSAERQAIAALAFLARVFATVQPDTEEVPELPPGQRRWSPEEKKLVVQARKTLDGDPNKLGPALRALSSKAFQETLLRAMRDQDGATRVEARLTLDELARLRRSLRDYLNTIPREKKPDSDARRKTAPRRDADVRRTSGTAVAASPVALFRQAPAKPSLEDDIRNLREAINQMGIQIVARGIRDPDARARRVTFEAIQEMGKEAGRFIPQVIQALKDPDLFVRLIAARALIPLAPADAAQAVPALVKLLDDEDLDCRIAAAAALAAYGPAAAGAVPALSERMLKGDSEFRIADMKAIEAIGTAAVAALPSLAKSFTNIDPRVRTEAARVLGRFGSSPKTRVAAKAYLPILRRLSFDPDTDVRKAAAGAVLEIDPEE